VKKIILAATILAGLVIPSQASAHSFPNLPHQHNACPHHVVYEVGCYRWIRTTGVIVQGPPEQLWAEASAGQVLVTCSSGRWHNSTQVIDVWYYNNGLRTQYHFDWINILSDHTYCQLPEYTSGTFNGYRWNQGPT